MDIVIIRQLGLQNYLATWQAMQQFTQQRHENTPDEIWILEHPPVFTQGQNGKAEHLLAPGDIPVIKVDRGGQITYHGPGQIVIYILIDIKRKPFNVREIVTLLENSVIDLLTEYQINAMAKREAPGVYIDRKKICSIGLRIKRGCTFHGLAFNVAMNMEPFSRIHPCGFPDLVMTQLSELYPNIDIAMIGNKLIEYLITNLGYTTISSPVITGLDSG